MGGCDENHGSIVTFCIYFVCCFLIPTYVLLRVNEKLADKFDAADKAKLEGAVNELSAQLTILRTYQSVILVIHHNLL